MKHSGKSSTTIDTPSKRNKLAPRKNPYWHGVSGGRGGVTLGYRKAEKGPGAWIGKIVLDGKRVEGKLGIADDPGSPASALPYSGAVSAALDWARQQEEGIAAQQRGESSRDELTIRSVVMDYVAGRRRRSPRNGRDAELRLTKHVLNDSKIADLNLLDLTSHSLRSWRQRSLTDLAPATVNRLLNDMRAALNAALESHRRQLPAHLPGEIRAGLKALAFGSGEARKQILTDTEVRRLVEAAFAEPDDGDFGRLVLLAAATGARFSQLAGLTIADVQLDQLRIMVPRSNKGRNYGSRPKIAVPVGADVITRLQPAIWGAGGMSLFSCAG
jgi:hypothetical protein